MLRRRVEAAPFGKWRDRLRRTLIIGGGLALIAAVAAIAVIGYVLVSGGSGEAGAPISAPTLSVPTAAPPTATAQANPSPAIRMTASPAPAAAATTPAPASAITASPSSSQPSPVSATAAAASPTPSPTAETTSAVGGQTLFRIVSEQSEARFEIDEILRGSPNRVIGRTNQVAGDVIIDFTNPSASQVGTIRINVRTLQTDDARRDRATRSQILQSARDEYEYAEFKPVELVGIPAEAPIGRTLSFQIKGLLTIRNISKEVIFDATVTPVSEDRLEGSAQAKIRRADFNLTIPSVPSVASVGEEVVLGLEFVAAPVPS